MDQTWDESLNARLEGSKHLDDRRTKYSPRFSAYSSFPWQQHRGLLPAVHSEVKDNPSIPEADRGHGQPLGAPQPDRQEGVRQSLFPLPVPTTLELRAQSN